MHEEDIAMADPKDMDRRTFMRGAGTLGALGMTGGLGSLLSACGGSGGSGTTAATTGAAANADAGTPARGGRAVLATVDKPVNLDAADGQLYSSIQVYQNIFASLLYVNEKFEYDPGLAARWEQEDEKTWRFDLVDNAVWHNDEPFRPEDVVYTFRRLKQHPIGSFTAAIDRVEKTGANQVRMHLKQPYGAIEPLVAGLVSIMNEKAVKAADPKLNPVGCGPYKMTEWVQDDHVTLQKWDKYFKADKPYLDEIVFRAVGDDSVRLTGLQTGELNWIQRVPPQRVAELSRSNDLAVSPGRPYNPDMIMFNCSKPPFDDPRVRQAVAWAIDRQEIVNLVWFGTAVPATEATAKPSPWYTGVDPYKDGPDLDKAQALLREAGIRGRLQVNFAGQPQVATQIREAQVIQSQLKKIGIDLNIQRFEPAQWFQQLATQKYDMTTTYFSATFDPAFIYGIVTRTGGSFNFPAYSDKQTDALIDKFVFENDQAVRKQVYPDLVRRIAEEAPILFLTNEIQQYWTQSNFHGPTPLPTLEIRAEEMWRKS
jgi:peptide/nickel transport system substrate-binding protein